MSLFNCLSCKGEIDLYKIKTRKHIIDLHERRICADCSDKELSKKRQKIIV